MSGVEHDASVEYRKFLCTDFLINSTNAIIGYVTKSGTSVQVFKQL